MKQTYLATAVSEFFTGKTQSFICNNGQVAIDSAEWRIFPDFDQAAEDYNQQVGRDVLHVGLLRQRAGEQTWHVLDEEYGMSDALRNPEIYGAGDNSSVRVIGFDDLRDEMDIYMAMAEDMNDEDRKAWTERVNEVFGKAVYKEMDDLNVLVIEEDLSRYEIAERHPVSWTEDTMHYRLALIADSSYDEDTLCNGYLEDVAEYLNAADNGITDPCEWLRNWCEDNACIYAQDSRYAFLDVDWAYDEREESILYMDEAGKFAVTGKELPALR